MSNNPIILEGGVDVDPALYGEPRGKWTQQPNKHRDKVDLQDIAIAKATNTPVIGICRGAQLLCVSNGGSLYQHSQPTKQNHKLETKDGLVIENGCPSSHHQIMRPKGDFVLYAWNPEPTKVWPTDEFNVVVTGTAEVVYWPEYRQIGVQGHPEWAQPTDPFLDWFNAILKQLEINYVF